MSKTNMSLGSALAIVVLVATPSCLQADAASALGAPPCCLAAPPLPDERGTAQQPLVVTATMPKTREEKSIEAAEREWRHKVDTWTIAIGWFTGVVLTLQLAAFLFQAFLLNRSLREARLATEATRRVARAERQTVETMSRTASRQLKAYVFIAQHQLRGMGQAVQIAIKNFGQTPAYRLRFDARAELAAEYPGAPAGPPVPPVGTLAPGAVYVIDNLPVTGIGGLAHPNANGDMESGALRIFVSGRVDYDDAFGNQRWMTFRLQTQIGAGWLQLVSCEQGNDSDPPE